MKTISFLLGLFCISSCYDSLEDVLAGREFCIQNIKYVVLDCDGDYCQIETPFINDGKPFLMLRDTVRGCLLDEEKKCPTR